MGSARGERLADAPTRGHHTGVLAASRRPSALVSAADLLEEAIIRKIESRKSYEDRLKRF
jgi:hypothetical protein